MQIFIRRSCDYLFRTIFTFSTNAHKDPPAKRATDLLNDVARAVKNIPISQRIYLVGLSFSLSFMRAFEHFVMLDVAKLCTIKKKEIIFFCGCVTVLSDNKTDRRVFFTRQLKAVDIFLP